MIFESFDRIRIINLAHRRDRRSEMERELAAVGWLNDDRIEFFPARMFSEEGRFYSAGARGCFASHLSIIEEAAERHESVLVLEDDCDFTQHLRHYRLPEEWDVFYGGFVEASDPDRLDSSDVVGTHFIGFSARTVQMLVPWLRAAFAGDDPAPIDGEYIRFRRANPDLIAVFADPHIGVQRPSRTDIGALRSFDRIFGIRSAVALARKVKRKLRRVSASRTAE